jgi:energy-coupling factor transporter ATP-binding protein EcfA2
MRIANPSYDVVFKYLMENISIAKDILSVILGKEIVSLVIEPQETSRTTDDGVRISRIDFKATIKNEDGTLETILIEIQKSRTGFKIERFRLYLALNYASKVAKLNKEKERIFTSYPITTIYFLGFRLRNIKVPIAKVTREYRNAVTNEKLNVKEDFVEKLSHDLYAIQIPRLEMNGQTELEQMLDVFNVDKYKTSDARVLDYTGNSSNPRIERVVKHLGRALVNNDKLLFEMLVEDEVEATLKEAEAKKDRAESKAKSAEQKVKVAEQKVEVAEQKTKAAIQEAEQQKALFLQEIENLKRQISDSKNDNAL